MFQNLKTPEIKPELAEKLKALPASPGCYLFRNDRGGVIYAGKSKALKNRVKQYFMNPDKKEGKYADLLREIADFSIVETASETDALLLECKLIKALRPKYNAQLTRDATYPFIRVAGLSGGAPSIGVVKERADDGETYIGCFRSKNDAESTLSLITDIWRIPRCQRAAFGKNARVCLNYHLGLCLGVCEGKVSEAAYRENLREVAAFFKGGGNSALRRLNREMAACVKAQRFEKAAALRDAALGLKRLRHKAKRLNAVLAGQKVFVFLRAYNEPRFSIFYICDGVTRARADFSSLKPEAAVLEAFTQTVACGEALPDLGLTMCVMEVFADKLFVTVKGAKDGGGLSRKLLKAHAEFLRG